MNFGFPQFFWALLALSIPLLIHLFNFRRPKTVFFSNTRLLEQLEQEQHSVRRLRHWFILFLRALALAALVLAFCLPFLEDDQEIIGKKDKTYLHLYIDNSQSMQRAGSEGPLLNQARIYAQDLLLKLEEGTEVQIFTNDPNPRYQRYYSPSEALELLKEIDYSYSFRDLGSSIQKTRDIESKEEGRHEILLLSDFQLGILPTDSFPIAENESLSLIPFVALEGVNNVSIDSLSFSNPVFVPGLAQKMEITLRNMGSDSLAGIGLEFYLNDTLEQARLVSLSADDTNRFQMEFIPKYAGNYRGEIRIDKGAPNFDNRFYFNFQTLAKQKVYFLSELTNSSLPLKVFQNRFFELKQDELNKLDYDYLSETRLIVVQSDQQIPASLKQQLEQHLERGKNIWVLPATNPSVFSEQLASLGIAVNKEWQKDSLMSQNINLDDPFLRGSFRSLTKRPSLPYTQAWLELDQGGYNPLLSAGPGRPILLYASRKRAKVFTSLSSLDAKLSNLSSHPVLVPALVNSAFFSEGRNKTYLRLGKSNDYQMLEAPNSEQALELQLSSGPIIPYYEYNNGRYQIALPGISTKPGSYSIQRDGKTLSHLSINVDARESLMSSSEKDLAASFSNITDIIDPLSNSEKAEIAAVIRQDRKSLGHWFLIIAMVALLLEMIFLKTKKA